MDIKSIIKIFRARFFNIRLLGNIRIGSYKEISVAELTEFIKDFREFCKSRNADPDNSNFKILERLCEQYYVYEGTDKFQRKIIQEVNEIIEELRADPQAQKDLELWLDMTQNKVVEKLRAEHPELKEAEIKLFCYIQAGFTPTMMSVLLKKDKSVIYNRVSRLKNKIY